MSELLWRPSPEAAARTNLAAFWKSAERRAGRDLRTYDDLWKWSVEDLEAFWQLVWEESGLIHSQGYTSVLGSRAMPGAQWFPGARLNFAENLLRFRDNRTAIIAVNEQGSIRRLTYAQLYAQTAACAEGFRRLGVKPGDRVAAYIPNIPEAVIAMLAATSLGALWSSCSPDFGLQGVLDRFGQIEPTLLLVADTYRYSGRQYDCLERTRELAAQLPSLTGTVVVSSPDSKSRALMPKAIPWRDLMAYESGHLDFAPLPFDHPVYIMYSSGTTGAPKCIVHGAGGMLLQHWKEHVLHTDLRRSDVITYYTTCGWMMWNWLVSALQVGAAIVLYDGSPVWPSPNRMWDLVDDQSITVFGTSAKYLSGCEQVQLRPRGTNRLTTLRTILSTGSPLPEEAFQWIYTDVKTDVQLASISGGTDIVSCFMLGNPMLPVHAGEIQCRGLGMKVEAWSDDGQPVINQVGELVCTAPAPSMPVSFWNDPDGSMYSRAYFEHFPGVWRHGDFIKINERGGVIVYGRSDATLNPGGVRIGTAEIYHPLMAIEAIADAVVIGQKWRDDIRIVLFVVLRDNIQLDEVLASRIRQTIRERASPRHVPAMILQVDGVPYTLNGKKVELAVAQVVEGQPVRNRHALANPEVLDQYAAFPELRG